MSMVCWLTLGTLAVGNIELGSFSLALDRSVSAPAVENAAAMIVKRPSAPAGESVPIVDELPANGDCIVLAVRASQGTPSKLLEAAPKAVRDSLPGLKAEGFRFHVESREGRRVAWIVGADQRGILFGAGNLVRHLVSTVENGSPRHWLCGNSDFATSPAYPLRGHQLGYRNRANSWDAWTVDQFETHIRELAIFGTNAIENIPFEDDTHSPHMKLPREQMNVRLSEICKKYDLEYWVWTPADFDLNDEAKRAAALKKHEKLYAECPRLDAVFFPGGDPGDNPPELVMPFLADCAKLLQKTHRQSKVWLSLQRFRQNQSEYVFDWLRKNEPDWFGGIVHGPSSPPLRWERQQLAGRYAIRSYPDVTHSVRSQYPIYWWDPAFAHTLGRECINPTPVYQKALHNWFAPYTCGFLSYSDGVHDDVNKCVWTALAWDPEQDVREIAAQYARAFFAPTTEGHSLRYADGLLALEKNWEGPLATNGAVAGTYALWRDPELSGGAAGDRNWRLEMCKLRADYDEYTRRRLLDETRQQQTAMALLADAKTIGADAAMKNALAALTAPVGDANHRLQMAELRKAIEARCDRLFELISLQTSVPKYQASGYERGCSLDFVDRPVNDRWWLEDEFARIAGFETEAAKRERLEVLRTWENPGPGSLYDDVGNVAKSPHVMRSTAAYTDFISRSDPNTGVMWWDNGFSRKKLAWIDYMDWPAGILYDHVDMNAKYRIRTTGYNQCLLRINGERVQPIVDGKEIGEFKVFEVPDAAVKTGKLLITFDRPDERHLNWRQHSRLCEIWLLKQP